MRLPLAAALVVVCANVSACGLVKPDYQPYEYVPASGDDGDDGDDTGGECTAGSQLTSFQSNVASPVNATCSGAACHASMSKMQLVKDQDDANRQKLLAYSGGDASKFTAFLHSNDHKGGNMSATLTATAIETWLAVEAKCK